MAKAFQENKETPNINFGKFQQEIVGIIDEIKSHNSTSLFGKMSLFGGKKEESSHVDGSIITQAFQSNKEVNRMVNEIDKEPRNSMVRLKLVNTLMNLSQDHELKDYKNMMLQAAIPIYLGDITPTILQVAIVVYQAYLTKLQNVHKQNMMAIRSTVLKNVNMGDIDVEEEASGSGKQTGKANDSVHTGVKTKDAVLIEIKVSENLLEKSAEALSDVKSKMSISLSHEEVESVTVQGQAASSFFGGGSQGPSVQKQNMVIGKSVKAIEALKPIPLLNSAGLNLAVQMGRIDNKLTYPLVMEGRLHMQNLRYHLLRIESGDREAREAMAPTFNQSIVAYRKAMKLVSKVNPKKPDLPVLTEFANLTYYGFIHRDLMRLTVDGVKSLLKLGQGAVDAAVLLNPQFTSLQGRLKNAKHQLEGGGGSVRAKIR